jgi:amino-acid N-acetyltransferase
VQNTLNYRAARPSDWPAIEALLVAAQLPLDGARDHLDNFIVGEAEGEVLCVGGYEAYERTGLLRSMAVAAALRGNGIGDQLLDAVKARARLQGAESLYLLTTTAAAFFSQRGFVQLDRNDAPAALQASREFQGACPASATMMVAVLAA